jgi:hypothetical protein
VGLIEMPFEIKQDMEMFLQWNACVLRPLPRCVVLSVTELRLLTVSITLCCYKPSEQRQYDDMK